MTGGRDQVVEALRHALGARWARVVRKGDTIPQQPEGGLLRRRTHLLTVDVRHSEPALQLVCALPREPTTEDTLLAAAVARTIAPEPRVARTAALATLLAPLTSGDVGSGEAILDAAIAAGRASSGALALDRADGPVFVRGTGRPILRRAALEAASGASGAISVQGRTFLAVPMGGPGLVLEGPQDPEAARAYATIAAGVLAGRARASAAPAATVHGAEIDLHAAVTAFPVPALHVDGRGVLAGISREAEGLLNLTADFDLGEPVAGKLREAVLEAVAAGRESHGDVSLSGRRFDVTGIALPSGGRLVLLVDRSREESLDRIQEDLVAGVAHELRTPVAALTALIQLLRLRASKLAPDKLELLLADGEREVSRLERMVEDLLLTARIATGGIVAAIGRVDLGAVASDVCRQLAKRYTDHHIEADGEGEALADLSLVRHVLWHLVDNAAKYSPAGTSVRVDVAAASRSVEVHVTDQGEGIFTGDIPRLFQRFHQLDASATRRHGGSGLGLYIVKTVIEAQGGQVFVKSRLGQGSTFSLRLPAAGPDDE